MYKQIGHNVKWKGKQIAQWYGNRFIKFGNKLKEVIKILIDHIGAALDAE